MIGNVMLCGSPLKGQILKVLFYCLKNLASYLAFLKLIACCPWKIRLGPLLLYF